jgi:uncharacterized membrane protein
VRSGSITGRRAVWLTGLFALVFLAGTYLPPLAHSGDSAVGGFLHAAYSPLCHQLPERSIVVGAGVQAVCARCAGLYAGGAAGLLLAAGLFVGRIRVRPVWLAWAVAPTLVDAALPWLGLPGLPNLSRLLLAVPAGLVAGLFLGAGIDDLVASVTGPGRGRPSLAGRPFAVEDTDG